MRQTLQLARASFVSLRIRASCERQKAKRHFDKDAMAYLGHDTYDGYMARSRFAASPLRVLFLFLLATQLCVFSVAETLPDNGKNSQSQLRSFTKADEVFPAIQKRKMSSVTRNVQLTGIETGGLSAAPTPFSLENLIDAFSSDNFVSSGSTDHPSTEPSISAAPTESPTIKPTARPTKEPTAAPSTSPMPSLVPTVVSSHQPSSTSMPSLAPTLTISNAPSKAPSLPPSTSTEPSATPSSEPTINLSESPSSRPSQSPTTSLVPSPFPTHSPSVTPSASPTSAPSAPPTLECHDKASYISPINGLGCEQHKHSPCENWRHIGLSDEQVLQLHNDCPVACRTDCVPYTLQPSAAPSMAPTSSPTKPLVDIIAFVEFYVHSVPGEIEGSTRQVFEQGMFEYFSEVIDDADSTSTTDLRAASLADQGTVGTNGQRSLRLMPKLDAKARFSHRYLPGSTNLKVKVIVEATSRALDDAMLEAIILSALDDGSNLSQYLTEDPFFNDAAFSTTLSSANVRTEGKIEPKAPTAAIVVSTIGVIAIAGFLTGHYFFRQRYNKTKQGGAFFTFSPKASFDVNDGVDPENFKTTGSIFSFEESPVHRNIPTGQNLRSLLGSRSHSNDATSASNSSSQVSLPPAMEHDQKIIVSPPNSPENLLAGIPPMIVIDNIDQNDEGHVDGPGKSSPNDDESSTRSREVSTESGMPIRRIEASSSLARALASNKEKPTSPRTLADMISTIKSTEEDGYPTDEGAKSPASRSLSPVAKSDSDSVASTPWRRNVPTERSHRKCYSHDEIDNVEPSEALDELIRTEWSKFGLDSPETNRPSEKSKEGTMTLKQTAVTERQQAHEKDSEEGGSIGDGESGTEGGNNEESRDKITSPRYNLFNKSRFKMTMLSKRMEEKQAEGECPKDAEENILPATLLAESASNISNVTNPSPMSGGESVAPPLITTSMSSSSPQATIRRLSLSPRKQKPTSSSLRGSINSDGKRVSGGFQYTFEAPSSGKLGIIIHKTVVHTVKDYSPLFGMIEPGDKIIKIDDIETDNMSTGEVTKVLASKRTGKRKNSGVIRMSVLSLYEKPGFTFSGKRRERQEVEIVQEKKKIKSVVIDDKIHDRSSKQPRQDQPSPKRSEQQESEQEFDNCEDTSSEPDEGEDTGLHLLGAIASGDDHTDDEGGFHLIAGGGSEESSASFEHLQFMANHITR